MSMSISFALIFLDFDVGEVVSDPYKEHDHFTGEPKKSHAKRKLFTTAVS